MTREKLKEHDKDLHSAITDEMRVDAVRDERQTSVSMEFEVWVKYRDDLYRILSRADGYHVYHVMPDEEVSVGVDNAEDAVQTIIGDEWERGESQNQ